MKNWINWKIYTIANGFVGYETLPVELDYKSLCRHLHALYPNDIVWAEMDKGELV